MDILKLKGACKDYIWGGSILKKEYGAESDKDIVAECWSLSCHPDGLSIIENGEYAGETLASYIEREGAGVLGANAEKCDGFPILIKLIDAHDRLSVQVHPDDGYALKHEGQRGKTEMWYILEAEPGAYIYYGFKEELGKEEFEKRIRENTLLDILNKVNVKKGDVFFIPPGTLHAIGAGIVLAEVQQSSNLTYRIYDYGRAGADGRKRELHIEKALDVTERKPPAPYKAKGSVLADCSFFRTELCQLGGNNPALKINAAISSFMHVLINDGSGTIGTGSKRLDFKKGDSFFIPAGFGTVTLNGSGEALVTVIP